MTLPHVRLPGISLHQIGLIRIHCLTLIFSKGCGGPWSSPILIEFLETLDFGVIISYLRLFMEKSYKLFKIGKIFNSDS